MAAEPVAGECAGSASNGMVTLRVADHVPVGARIAQHIADFSMEMTGPPTAARWPVFPLPAAQWHAYRVIFMRRICARACANAPSSQSSNASSPSSRRRQARHQRAGGLEERDEDVKRGRR